MQLAKASFPVPAELLWRLSIDMDRGALNAVDAAARPGRSRIQRHTLLIGTYLLSTLCPTSDLPGPSPRSWLDHCLSLCLCAKPNISCSVK